MPPAPLRAFNKTIQLGKLQTIADSIVADQVPQTGADAAQIEELLLVGTSMGGARPDLDAQKLFRRMCFNALISNADDHPRNHAMIARHTDWRLSPAYDLTPTSPVSQDHCDLALVIGDQGRFANAQNLLSQCSRFLLTREAATATMVAMTRTVANRWYDIARDAGVSESDCTLIAGAFAYPGF